MSNSQARLFATAIALLAGAVMASTSNLDINVGITVILISGILFLVEYVRNQRG